VVREITGEPSVDPEVGPMWLIRFEDGFETEAWPEEVFDDAMTETQQELEESVEWIDRPLEERQPGYWNIPPKEPT
jgi:hypothetical protein